MSTFHSKSLKGFERLAQKIEHFTCDSLFLIQTRHNQSQWSESDRIAASASSKTHHYTVSNDFMTNANHIACRHWTNRYNFTKLVNFTRNISVDHASRTGVRFKLNKSNNACPRNLFGGAQKCTISREESRRILTTTSIACFSAWQLKVPYLKE